ncbi:hypothetical protein GOV13_02185 [Candidatus Pacearchaeota archaeon]|nr:hypothetical protein [Candidatus Pacearchaeota archaeon]
MTQPEYKEVVIDLEQTLEDCSAEEMAKLIVNAKDSERRNLYWLYLEDREALFMNEVLDQMSPEQIGEYLSDLSVDSHATRYIIGYLKQNPPKNFDAAKQLVSK